MSCKSRSTLYAAIVSMSVKSYISTRIFIYSDVMRNAYVVGGDCGIAIDAVLVFLSVVLINHNKNCLAFNIII